MLLLFSDIHSSRKAAKLLEKLAPEFDQIYCCGDICGYDYDFEYVIDTLINLNVRAVLGNHDHMVLNRDFSLHSLPSRVVDPILWTREKLTGRYLEYLQNLPTEIEEGVLYITHTLDFDFYIREMEHCLPLLARTNKPFLGIGHTHIPATFQFEQQVVINPGSISFGRKGAAPGYAAIDEATISVALKRVEE